LTFISKKTWSFGHADKSKRIDENKFDFKVVEIEVHEVEFYFNQFCGNLFIKLDGNNIIKTVRLFSFNVNFKK
jgi:hypothetical protein